MIIMKFGGSSVADAQKIRGVAEIVKANLHEKPVVIASALRGVTDELLALAKDSLAGDRARLQGLRKQHLDAADALGVDGAPLAYMLDQLGEMSKGIALLRELTPRSLDMVASYGERLSTRLIAAYFNAAGIPARQHDAQEAGLVTDDRFGAAAPLPEAEALIRQRLQDWREVPVITGFIGRSKAGDITTLGRNGSDFSATIFGAALNCREVQIWSDTDGVLTADPRLVAGAQPIDVLSFEEACELAYYGGRVLHPHTLVPAMRKNIPVRVRNTFKPQHPGTAIVASPQRKTRGVKSIAFKRHQFVFSVTSPRMAAGYGFLSRIFAVFAKREIDVDMLSTSEVSVSATVGSERNLEAARQDLSGEFSVSIEKGKAVICVVGEGLQSSPGIAAEVFGAVRQAGINVLMISQGASKINLAFVIDDCDVEKAVSALHARLFASAVSA